jgi:hypothetical protein
MPCGRIVYACSAAARATPLCRSDAERGTIRVGEDRNQCMWGSTERGRWEKAPKKCAE